MKMQRITRIEKITDPVRFAFLLGKYDNGPLGVAFRAMARVEREVYLQDITEQIKSENIDFSNFPCYPKQEPEKAILLCANTLAGMANGIFCQKAAFQLQHVSFELIEKRFPTTAWKTPEQIDSQIVICETLANKLEKGPVPIWCNFWEILRELQDYINQEGSGFYFCEGRIITAFQNFWQILETYDLSK